MEAKTSKKIYRTNVLLVGEIKESMQAQIDKLRFRLVDPQNKLEEHKSDNYMVSHKERIYVDEQQSHRINYWNVNEPNEVISHYPLTREYVKNKDLILLVYDPSDKETFDHLKMIYRDEIKPTLWLEPKKPKIMLVSAPTDENQLTVSADDAINFMTECGLYTDSESGGKRTFDHIMVSITTGEGIDKLEKAIRSEGFKAIQKEEKLKEKLILQKPVSVSEATKKIETILDELKNEHENIVAKNPPSLTEEDINKKLTDLVTYANIVKRQNHHLGKSIGNFIYQSLMTISGIGNPFAILINRCINNNRYKYKTFMLFEQKTELDINQARNIATDLKASIAKTKPTDEENPENGRVPSRDNTNK